LQNLRHERKTNRGVQTAKGSPGEGSAGSPGKWQLSSVVPCRCAGAGRWNKAWIISSYTRTLDEVQLF